MNAEIKAKWVAALRSGEYEQGQTYLRSGEKGDKYCCLGVLCDLRNPGIWESCGGFGVKGEKVYGFDGMTGHLSEATMEWAGFESFGEVSLVHENTRTGITFLNDAERLSFSQIADLIEEQL